MKDADLWIVPGCWFTRGRRCFARPDPGIDASVATSFLMRHRHRSLVAALASAPVPQLCCGITFVTGPADSPPVLGTRTDQPGASLEVSFVPFSVRWSRRTVQSYHASDHSASALFRPRHPRQGVSSPMRFFCLASPRCVHFRALETPPAQVIRGRFLSGLRTGPTPDCYRDLTGTVKVRVTLVGFT